MLLKSSVFHNYSVHCQINNNIIIIIFTYSSPRKGKFIAHSWIFLSIVRLNWKHYVLFQLQIIISTLRKLQLKDLTSQIRVQLTSALYSCLHHQHNENKLLPPKITQRPFINYVSRGLNIRSTITRLVPFYSASKYFSQFVYETN